MDDTDDKKNAKEVKKSTITNCRMYESKYPKVDDLVMVEVKSIEEMGAYVALKEYNDIEGMILLSELSRRRIRSINKIIRVGRLEVVVVLRVDEDKGYIDLSKRRVSEEDAAKCEEKYNKSKAVHSILRHVAETQNRDLEQLYIKIGWPLYKKYGHAYEAFKLAISEPEAVFEGIEIEADIKDSLIQNIKRRLTPQPLKIRADIEVTCFHYEGIDAIKAALQKGIDTTTAETPITVKLVAPPLYVVFTTSLNKEAGIAAVKVAIAAIKEEILKRKGNLVEKVAPRAVQARDDIELSAMMDKYGKENRDTPESEDEDKDTDDSEAEDDDEDEPEDK